MTEAQFRAKMLGYALGMGKAHVFTQSLSHAHRITEHFRAELRLG